MSVKQLLALAPDYFHRTPEAMLVFFQPPETVTHGSDDVLLSVVVPVYGCADCLAALHARLTDSVRTITDRYELVFVDDRSVDDGWAVLVRLAREDPHVRAFRLSRNFGQDAAITAGLTQATRGMDGGHGLRSPGGARGHPAAVGGGRRGLRHRAHGPARLAPLGVPAERPAACTAA